MDSRERRDMGLTILVLETNNRANWEAGEYERTERNSEGYAPWRWKVAIRFEHQTNAIIFNCSRYSWHGKDLDHSVTRAGIFVIADNNVTEFSEAAGFRTPHRDRGILSEAKTDTDWLPEFDLNEIDL